MPVQIYPVNNQQHLTEFCLFPREIYRKGEYSVCYGNPGEIFNPQHNPVLRHLTLCCFTAHQNHRIVGRIAAIKDSLNPQPATGFFGCFECENNAETATALLTKAAQWLSSHGCDTMIGPATFNTNQQVGLLIEGFESGYQPGMPYNPPYYHTLMLNAGLEKLTDLLSFQWKQEDGTPSRLSRVAARVNKNNDVNMRRINLRNPMQEIDFVKQVFNQAMANNWGYIPLTRAEVSSMLYHLARYSDPDLQLAISWKGHPAGIALCTPSPLPSKRGNKSTRAAILGIVPQYRQKGLDALLMAHLMDVLAYKGYDEVDLSQIHENNEPMIKRITQVLASPQTRRFRIYQKNITY